MHAATFALEEVEQDAFARERVTERVALGPPFLSGLDDELRVDRRPQGPNEIRIQQACHAAQEIEVEILADDRGVAQDVLRLRRQRCESFQDGVAQRVGDRDLGDVLRLMP